MRVTKEFTVGSPGRMGLCFKATSIWGSQAEQREDEIVFGDEIMFIARWETDFTI